MPGVTAEMSATELVVEPGHGATVELRVRNTAAVETEFRFEIVGAPREWGSISPLRVTVAPQREATARLSFHPPRSSRSTPGPVAFQVRVVPMTDASAAIVIDGVVDVASFSEMTASLSPVHSTPRQVRHQLIVENRGNAPTGATIEAMSARGGLIVRATPSRVELAPGGSADVEVTARAWRPRLRPPRRPPAFRAVVRPDGRAIDPGADITVEASLPVRPARRGHRRKPLLALLIVVALVAGFAATRGDDERGVSTVAPRNGVGARTETFVDASRPTASHGSVGAQPERTLATLVYYPATGPVGGAPVDGAPPATDQGPYPLIVFGAGSRIEERYGDLLRSWAASGYVVAAPTFPFSASQDPADRSLDDYPNQPADMSFVARELVRLSAEEAGPLRGLIDAERIGAAGVALGGITTLGLVANTCCQDPRFKAAAVMAANQAAFGDGEYFRAPGPPLLVLHGDRDDTIPYADARKTFIDAPGPAFLVTILGGGHSDPFIGPVDQPMNAVTLTTTLAFFDHYLRGDADGLKRLRAEATVPEVARLEQRA